MAAFMLALALTLSTPAVQDPAVEKDARCVAALTRLSASAEKADAKNALNGIFFFFLGRLSARVTPDRLEGAINTAAELLPKEGLRDVGLDCINQMRVLSGAADAS